MSQTLYHGLHSRERSDAHATDAGGQCDQEYYWKHSITVTDQNRQFRVAALRDITQPKVTEDKLREAKEKAVDAKQGQR